MPNPPDRRPTDEERRTTALADARWITADMAYRRAALLATGGFDERFPRAFREDSDLALRTLRAGFTIVAGRRITIHPVRPRGGWRGSIAAQRGNADNALLHAKFGRVWRAQIGESGGRTGRQLGLYVPVETAEKLKALSARTDIPQTRLLRQALQLLFEKYEDGSAQKSGRSRKSHR